MKTKQMVTARAVLAHQVFLLGALALQTVVSFPNASYFGKVAKPIWLPPNLSGTNKIFGEYAWFRRELTVQPDMEQAVCSPINLYYRS